MSADVGCNAQCTFCDLVGADVCDTPPVDICERAIGPRPMPLDVRRPDVSGLPAEVVQELCAWCGVDRAGSCGACSDLRVVKR